MNSRLPTEIAAGDGVVRARFTKPVVTKGVTSIEIQFPDVTSPLVGPIGADRGSIGVVDLELKLQSCLGHPPCNREVEPEVASGDRSGHAALKSRRGPVVRRGLGRLHVRIGDGAPLRRRSRTSPGLVQKRHRNGDQAPKRETPRSYPSTAKPPGQRVSLSYQCSTAPLVFASPDSRAGKAA